MARPRLVSALRDMPRPVRRMLLARSAVLWVLARIVAMTGAVVDGPITNPAVLAPSAAALTVLLTGGLLVLDVRRRGEHVLLGNLGIGTGAVAVAGGALPAAAELLISLAAAL